MLAARRPPPTIRIHGGDAALFSRRFAAEPQTSEARRRHYRFSHDLPSLIRPQTRPGKKVFRLLGELLVFTWSMARASEHGGQPLRSRGGAGPDHPHRL